MQSDRRGQAQSALRAVEGRHKEIQKIEEQMVELAQLFQDLNEIVVQQEPLVENIEQKGEEVRDNVVKANEEISTAIVSARSRNRKKWYCLALVSKCFSPHSCVFVPTTCASRSCVTRTFADRCNAQSSSLSSSPSSSPLSSLCNSKSNDTPNLNKRDAYRLIITNGPYSFLSIIGGFIRNGELFLILGWRRKKQKWTDIPYFEIPHDHHPPARGA